MSGPWCRFCRRALYAVDEVWEDELTEDEISCGGTRDLIEPWLCVANDVWPYGHLPSYDAVMMIVGELRLVMQDLAA